MMSSVLTVTTAAADRTLLTLAELCVLLDIEEQAQDAALTSLNRAVAAAITKECKVYAAGASPPTLRSENLREEFRPTLERAHRHHRTTSLLLARRPVTAISLIVEAGVTLETTDYRLDASTGELVRLLGDRDGCWAHDTIVVAYTAGWEMVPDGLKGAAERLARLLWSERGRDPLVRSEDITGVGSTSYWIGSVSDPAVPQDVADELAEYRNING
jgi:hypothetical protein